MTGATRRRGRPGAGGDAEPAAKKTGSAASAGTAAAVRKPALSESTLQRLLLRLAVLIAAIAVYLYGGGRLSADRQQPMLAGAGETVPARWQQVECAAEFVAETAQFAGCAPRRCGRLVTDGLVSAAEAMQLRAVAERAFQLTGGGAGGASILDLHSGALSRGAQFVNLYKLPETGQLVSADDLQLYVDVRQRVRTLIAQQFGCGDAERLHPTGPTFFSRLTAAPARSVHDQYWHVHVDRQQYGAFHFTALLYLSQADAEFTGGQLEFVGAAGNSSVAPRPGRITLFTSGAENPHRVEPVTAGQRYALTIAFTCDQQHAIGEPTLAGDQRAETESNEPTAAPEATTNADGPETTPGDEEKSQISAPEHKSQTSTPEYRSTQTSKPQYGTE